ncbi:MAG: hypothetical protein QM770_02500 [Tepidisphaeraceae bacterium]
MKLEYAPSSVRTAGRRGRTFWLSLLALAAAFLLPTSFYIADRANRHRDIATPRDSCFRALREIGRALQMYAQGNNGQQPDSFDTLANDGYVPAALFVCTQSNDTSAKLPTTQPLLHLGSGFCSYAYVGPIVDRAERTSGTVIAIEGPANHGDGFHVLLIDDGSSGSTRTRPRPSNSLKTTPPVCGRYR